MNGKLVGGLIVIVALAAGAALYYAQVYGYYRQIAATDAAARIRLISVVTAAPEEIPLADFQGIDAESSPLRFRACFEIDTSLATLTDTYALADGPVPLTGPGWFACYDAETIGAALDSGEALAFLSEPGIHPGVDRIVAVFADGRGYAWHQLEPEPAR